VLASYIRITGGKTFVGWRRSEGWARDQIVYFAGEFSRGFESCGIGVNGNQQAGLREARGRNIQAYFTFEASPDNPVLVKVGISSVSIAGALNNLHTELPGWDFERTKADALKAWEIELNKIQVSGGTPAQLTTFYTALYHSMLAPNLFSDVDGQYRGRDFNNHTCFISLSSLNCSNVRHALACRL
jgi:putative alpha-1,2-mannosidase